MSPGSVARATLTSRSVLPAGTSNEYALDWAGTPRPLPPVTTPSKVPPVTVIGTTVRTGTGISVPPPRGAPAHRLIGAPGRRWAADPEVRGRCVPGSDGDRRWTDGAGRTVLQRARVPLHRAAGAYPARGRVVLLGEEHGGPRSRRRVSHLDSAEGTGPLRERGARA